MDVRQSGKIGLTPARVALIYVFISVVWIVLSSELVLRELRHPVAITTAEIGKGIGFVLATGALIFVICKKALERMMRQRERLRHSEEERSELQAQLIQAQKLEAIGRLAGGVAHDFNNILTVILSSCHLLHEEVASNGGGARVQMIETAADRAASLTRQLLAFSRHQVLEIDSINLNAVIEETARLLERVLGEDVRLVQVLQPELGNIMADPSQMTQVLMNLVINARDAMPKGGVIEIHTENLEADEKTLERTPHLTAGSKVVLSVKDNGEGMSPEIQEKIFEPFFSTKEPGKGTGLGLSTVYGIVKQSGGAIDLRSAPGQGSTFRIFFPRAEKAAAAKPAVPTLRANGGDETILVVDDDDLVRRAVSDYLVFLGYKTLQAENAAAALDLARAHEAKIDLLLTDLVMPDMTGPELRTQVERWRPLIRTLYMTGYASDRVPLAKIEPKQLLRKPFAIEALASGVRRTLEGDTAAAK